MKEGEITTLPVLDALATLTGADRFRQLPLHQASTKLSGSTVEGFTLSELVMESLGLVRVEGELKIKNGVVTGTVQLGLTPGHVGRIPGGRTVFASEKQGYLWTPVTLSGPVVSPSEDLSSRLVRAAAGEVMGQATSTLEKGAKGAREATKSLLDAVSPLLPMNPSSLLPATPDAP